MKKITKMLLLMVLLAVSKIYGQYYPANDYFTAANFPEILDANNYSASTDFNSFSFQPKVYNVHFYGLRIAGSTTTIVTENYALERIAALNIAFNPYNIFFKYRGFDYYNEIYNGSELTNQSHNTIINRMYEVAQSEGKDNNINIVLHHETCANDKGSADINKKIISLRYCTAQPFRVVYQMGHLLGLLKTYRGTGGGDVAQAIPLNECANHIPSYDKLMVPNHSNSYDPENVTRDPSNAYYNADTTGDRVTDTPAAFRCSELNYCHLDYPNSTFQYITDPSITDNSPDHLMYDLGDLLNFMCLRYSNGNNPLFGMFYFTSGQGVRMRETIAIPSLNFSAVETTVASLYEPYKVLENTTSNTNTAASRTVSLPSNIDFTAYLHVVRIAYYQPGFDYEVYRCSDAHSHYGSVLSSYYKDDCFNPYFDTEDIPHFDYTARSIRILQLSDNVYGPCRYGFTGFVRQGSIYTHNQGTYTAQPLDSIQINDPNLLINLSSGTHTINVTTDSGEILQKTIQKTP